MNQEIKIPEKFLPPGAFPAITKILSNQELDVKIVKSRSTKFADFNPPFGKKKIPLITINNNLNPYSFLLTLLHEYAHYLVWKDGHHYAKPHGKTWKNHFRVLIQFVMDRNIFPDELAPQIAQHIQNPGATSCTDIKLFKKLSAFDGDRAGIFIDEIPDSTLFHTPNGQLFKKEKKVRKRILCTCQEKKKKYLFTPIYRVFPVKEQQYMLIFP